MFASLDSFLGGKPAGVGGILEAVFPKPLPSQWQPMGFAPERARCENRFVHEKSANCPQSRVAPWLPPAQGVDLASHGPPRTCLSSLWAKGTRLEVGFTHFERSKCLNVYLDQSILFRGGPNFYFETKLRCFRVGPTSRSWEKMHGRFAKACCMDGHEAFFVWPRRASLNDNTPSLMRVCGCCIQVYNMYII